jgi:hypothetical protein
MIGDIAWRLNQHPNDVLWKNSQSLEVTIQ